MQSKIERNPGLVVNVAKNSPARISTVVELKIFVTMHRGAKNNSFYVWIDGEARDFAFVKSKAKHEIRSKKRHTVEKVAAAIACWSGPWTPFRRSQPLSVKNSRASLGRRSNREPFALSRR